MSVVMGTSSRRAAWSLLVGLVAAGISLGRLWLGNRDALQDNLWAEDGLFPLCIHKADFLTCLGDPFAGYFLFLPRVLAWPISLLPVEAWALGANLVAAALAGIVAACAFLIMARAGLGVYVSVAVALLPVITPMVGLEAINAIGSSYMLLLFLATLALLFRPVSSWTRVDVALVGVLLLVTSLTIPSALVLVLILAVQLIRNVVSPRVFAVWIVAVALGLVTQAFVAFSAPTKRPLSASDDSFDAWANSVPTSLLTYWPGLSIGEYSFFTNFTLSPLGATGWLSVIVIVVLGLWQLRTGWKPGDGNGGSIGLLLMAGLAFGLIPSVIGYTNNRYFVVPLLLWGAALLVWLDPVIRRSRPWLVAVITVLVLFIWWPAMAASEYRSTPAPPWGTEVERIKAKCLSDPAFVERPIFTPFWPPNWGDGLDEPTHPNLPCTVVFRWLG